MRLQVVKSKNAASLYMIESTYIDGKHSSRVVEKLGTEAALCEKQGGQDPYVWAKTYVEEQTRLEREGKRIVTVEFDPSKQIEQGKNVLCDIGCLLPQVVCSGLRLDSICDEITQKHGFMWQRAARSGRVSAESRRDSFLYDLAVIMRMLICTRILNPLSKMSSYEASKRYLEQPNCSLADVYKALDVLEAESHYIQAQVYENSKALVDRNTAVLYYDCTNYFFEVEEEDNFRQYGLSKENRPTP
jgi:hypothetical protein